MNALDSGSILSEIILHSRMEYILILNHASLSIPDVNLSLNFCQISLHDSPTIVFALKWANEGFKQIKYFYSSIRELFSNLDWENYLLVFSHSMGSFNRYMEQNLSQKWGDSIHANEGNRNNNNYDQNLYNNDRTKMSKSKLMKG